MNKNKSYLGLYSCSVAAWFWLSSKEPSSEKCVTKSPTGSGGEQDKFAENKSKPKETRDIAVNTSDVFTNTGKKVAWDDQKELEREDKEQFSTPNLERPDPCETSEEPITSGSSTENRCSSQLETSEEQLSSQTPPPEMEILQDPLPESVQVCPRCGMFHTIRQHYLMFPWSNVGHVKVDDVVLPTVDKQQSHLKLAEGKSFVDTVINEAMKEQVISTNIDEPLSEKRTTTSSQKFELSSGRNSVLQTPNSRHRSVLKQLKTKKGKSRDTYRHKKKPSGVFQLG
ncbi:unnamed protein product [Hermetia illucens]|uniref:Uncharacterized protein n=1 Tax=Hermetia illucens TaxID=343691 RepID=A0A7R8YW06_HERIL|nr:unnamed protein product [Hermetia illucens]